MNEWVEKDILGRRNMGKSTEDCNRRRISRTKDFRQQERGGRGPNIQTGIRPWRPRWAMVHWATEWFFLGNGYNAISVPSNWQEWVRWMGKCIWVKGDGWLHLAGMEKEESTGDSQAPGDEDAMSRKGKIECASHNLNLNFWVNRSAADQ